MRTQHTNHVAFLGSTQPAPIFQLPPPPPSMQWHRTDGWQERDLAQGMRPLVVNEESQPGDEHWTSGRGPWKALNLGGIIYDEGHTRCRTRRPLTFMHAGKTWTWHRPGDPMPCDGEKMVILLRENREEYAIPAHANRGKHWSWSDATIIGWRYADETKTAPLGPEDVRCGDEVQFVQGDRRAILRVTDKAVEIHGLGSVSFLELQISKARIRRRDSDAWEPCSKEVLA